MGSLGMQEIIVIFLLALIIFGPRKLPELGKTLGKGLAEFKKASNELRQTWEEEVRLDKEKEAVSGFIKDTSNEISDAFNESSSQVTDALKDSSTEIPDAFEDDSAGSKEIQ